MKRLIASLPSLLLAAVACSAPEDANQAPRCHASQPCEIGLVCYRGFCVASDEVSTSPFGATDAAIVDDPLHDSGSSAPNTDGSAPPLVHPRSSVDASAPLGPPSIPILPPAELPSVPSAEPSVPAVPMPRTPEPAEVVDDPPAVPRDAGGANADASMRPDAGTKVSAPDLPGSLEQCVEICGVAEGGRNDCQRCIKNNVELVSKDLCDGRQGNDDEDDDDDDDDEGDRSSSSDDRSRGCKAVCLTRGADGACSLSLWCRGDQCRRNQ